MLTLVATPIGNPGDLTLRAIEVLKSSDLIIGEEKKETELLMRRLEISNKSYRLLNEHSDAEDLALLLESCRSSNVALITDCGTPGFCDPGADLVEACRKAGIPVTAAPGASSLMTFFSLLGRRLESFHFEGFLPRENVERTARLSKLLKFRIPVIVMDTPYRLRKLIDEICVLQPDSKLILGCDLTQSSEQIYVGTAKKVSEQIQQEKAEFILLIEPTAKS